MPKRGAEAGSHSMRVFVYEFISGGGLLDTEQSQPLQSDLLAEGLAMASALVSDFAALPDVQVVSLRDHRLRDLPPPPGDVRIVQTAAEERAVFVEVAASADW